MCLYPNGWTCFLIQATPWHLVTASWCSGQRFCLVRGGNTLLHVKSATVIVTQSRVLEIGKCGWVMSASQDEGDPRQIQKTHLQADGSSYYITFLQGDPDLCFKPSPSTSLPDLVSTCSSSSMLSTPPSLHLYSNSSTSLHSAYLPNTEKVQLFVYPCICFLFYLFWHTLTSTLTSNVIMRI